MARRKARRDDPDRAFFCAMGRPVADLDLLIAACAVRYGLGVATLNAKNFSNIEGLRWLDWST
jgi:predicted nucleic acid-binding protein